MIPRYGRPPKSGQRYRLRPGAYAIISVRGGVLLTHQDAPVPEFQLPGGGIDPGETPLPALRREVLEETGWHIGAARRLGAFRRFAFMPEYGIWAEKLCVIYLARGVMPHSAPTELGHAAVVMAPQIALSKLGNPGDHAMLRRAIRFGLVR